MFRLLLAFCLLLPAASAWPRPAAVSPEAAEQRLRELRGRLEVLQRTVEARKSQVGAVAREVEAMERKIAGVHEELRKLDRQLEAQSLRVQLAQARLDEAEHKLGGQRQSLSAQVRAAYVMGQNSGARLLLNLSDIHVVDRMTTYFNYLSRARARHMQALTAQADQLRALRDRLEDEAETLTALREEQESVLQRLKALRADREAQLAKMRQTLGGEESELRALRESEREMAQVFASIQNALREAPPPPAEPVSVSAPSKPVPSRPVAPQTTLALRSPTQPSPAAEAEAALKPAVFRPFTQMRGQLPWPVRGPLLAAYGQPKAGGRLSWNGHWIGAAPGAPVRAVARGRVVYTGWMHRYGLIAILEHDNGYFTLYGHNQSVIREVGDVVQGGEMIATAGNTGGHGEAGVYFEVRKGTLSLDPRSWLSR